MQRAVRFQCVYVQGESPVVFEDMRRKSVNSSRAVSWNRADRDLDDSAGGYLFPEHIQSMLVDIDISGACAAWRWLQVGMPEVPR